MVTQSPTGGIVPSPQPTRDAQNARQAAVFQVENARYAYPHSTGGRVALAGVSLTIESGTIVGVLGPNGSGKTTLLHLLAGLLRPQHGRVLTDGAPLDQLPPRALAQRVAIVPQTTVTTFGFTALDLVLMGRYPHLGPLTLEGPADLAIARDALAATDTSHLEGRLFSTLSGGERQRVAIASALAQASRTMLLDEPTASLDLGHQLELVALVRRLNAERRTTFVVSTHDVNLASSLCTHVALLRDGCLLAYGATREIITAETMRTLYGVDADVQYHASAGRLTVVPIGRAR